MQYRGYTMLQMTSVLRGKKIFVEVQKQKS